MNLLKTLGDGQGHLKAGFLGFQGSGKSYTAVLLAVAVKRFFKLPGPIAFIDTENASEYISPTVVALTGQKPVGIRTRNFDHLLAAADECVSCQVSVMVADSMTHFWRTVCDSYLAGVNEQRRKKGFGMKLKLEFQDWGQVKGEWAKWTEKYLNLPLHIIICGRAGYEYSMEKNDETGRTELTKTGIRMKTEAEFGFEPSLLVEMSVEQQPDKQGGFRQVRSGIVLKDRFNVIDASVFNFAKGVDHEAELKAVEEAFGPHLRMLKPGAHSTVETKVPPMDVNEEGDVEWSREKTARTILCEEIQGLIVSQIPGMGAEDKKRKADLMEAVFGTRSWTAIERTNSAVLRRGLDDLKVRLGVTPATPAPPDDDLPMDSAKTPAPEVAAESRVVDVTEISRLRSELSEAIFGQEEKVLTWMREAGWLKKGQDFTKLSIERLREAVKKHGVILSKANGTSDAALPARTADDDVPTP